MFLLAPAVRRAPHGSQLHEWRGKGLPAFTGRKIFKMISGLLTDSARFSRIIVNGNHGPNRGSGLRTGTFEGSVTEISSCPMEGRRISTRQS